MYAVIRSGGKQYRVEPGKTVRLETLEGKLGGKITFEDMMLVHADEKKFVSAEYISKVKIISKIVEQGRGPKLKTLKYLTGRKYNFLRGHRQITRPFRSATFKYRRGTSWHTKKAAGRPLMDATRTDSGLGSRGFAASS